MAAFFFVNSFYFKFILSISIFINGTVQMTNINFVSTDYESAPITPAIAEGALKFVETFPELEPWQYVQFRRYREAINTSFADPYSMEAFEDKIGSGYVSSVSDHQSIDDDVKILLFAYIHKQGFMKLEMQFTGFYKTVETIKHKGEQITLNRSEKQSYIVKLYTALKCEG